MHALPTSRQLKAAVLMPSVIKGKVTSVSGKWAAIASQMGGSQNPAAESSANGADVHMLQSIDYYIRECPASECFVMLPCSHLLEYHLKKIG